MIRALPPPAVLATVGATPEDVTPLRGVSRGAWLVQGTSAVVASQAEEAQAAASIAAAACGTSPRVVDYLDGWLVAEWVRGEHLTPVQLRRPRVLEELAELLTRWHASDVVLPVLRLSDAREAYCRQGALPPEVLVAVSWADEAERALTATQQRPPVPCHLDVVANLLATENGLRLIDFEYAAVADPMRELGQVLWEAELDRLASEHFIHRYAGPDAHQVAAAATWCAVAAVTWTAWGFAQPGLEMSRYARRSWQRLRHHWARPPDLPCG